MKITKYVHSCLLVEAGHQKILVDPGSFSWDSRMLHSGRLDGLTHIIVTHEHMDHYNEDALRYLSQQSPHAQIITNNDLLKKIDGLNLPNPTLSGSQDDILVFEAPHVPLPMRLPVPLNIGVHISDMLTHPGDAYKFSRSREILALPITAPFASFKEALNTAVRLKPKMVIPIHDWEWHKTARESRYNFARQLLEPKKIEFVPLENAETVEF